MRKFFGVILSLFGGFNGLLAVTMMASGSIGVGIFWGGVAALLPLYFGLRLLGLMKTATTKDVAPTPAGAAGSATGPRPAPGHVQKTGALEKEQFVGTSKGKQIVGYACILFAFIGMAAKMRQIAIADKAHGTALAEAAWAQGDLPRAWRILEAASATPDEAIDDEEEERAQVDLLGVAIDRNDLPNANKIAERLAGARREHTDPTTYTRSILERLRLADAMWPTDYAKAQLMTATLLEKEPARLPFESLAFQNAQFQANLMSVNAEQQRLEAVAVLLAPFLNMDLYAQMHHNGQMNDQFYQATLKPYADQIATLEFWPKLRYALVRDPQRFIPVLNKLCRVYGATTSVGSVCNHMEVVASSSDRKVIKTLRAVLLSEGPLVGEIDPVKCLTAIPEADGLFRLNPFVCPPLDNAGWIFMEREPKKWVAFIPSAVQHPGFVAR